MDLLLLERRGFSQRQIAKKLGISRNTVKKFIENRGDPEERKTIQRKSLLDPYQGNIAYWLDDDLEYRATWIYDRLANMGFTGSYEIVKRKVHEIKAEKQRVAYMRFETEPGFQAQVDFGEFQVENLDGTIRKLYLFSMILGYSRKIYGELIDHCDLPTFLDCHINAFEYFGGVPDEILYDRMKNV
ncbi:MAG: IS21 family transposase, partial [bacterium]